MLFVRQLVTNTPGKKYMRQTISRTDSSLEPFQQYNLAR